MGLLGTLSVRWTRVVGAGAVLALLVAACGDGAEADEEGPITIGVVTSRTGDLAPTGIQVWAGVEFAAQQRNDEGGIDGREINVILEDDRSTPTDALSAFQRLTSEEDPTAIWGPTFTPQVLAMEPAVVEAEIPVFVSPTAPIVTQQGDGWFFR